MQKTLARPPVTERKVKGLHNEVIVITPDVAKAWLDKNKNNRRVSPVSVRSYARDMAAGNWLLTGDPIRFDEDGNLMDGQHRLMACVKAEKPFASVVIYGLPAELKNQIDVGRKRSVADVLTMAGYHNATYTQAIARLMLRYRDEIDSDTGHTHTHAEVLGAIERHPAIHAASAKVHNVKIIPRAILGFQYYVGAHILNMPDRAEAMVQVFATGVPDYPGCAMHRMRERILRVKDASTNIGGNEMRRLLAASWNRFAKREEALRAQTPREWIIDGLNRDAI